VTGASIADEWRPVICLRAQEVKMDTLQLTVEGAAYSWLYNLLASLFAELIKFYLEAALMDLIRENAGELLDSINGFINTPATGERRRATMDTRCTANRTGRGFGWEMR
jgi:hypothetical protein